MGGTVAIIVVLVVIVPVLIMLTGLVASGLMGWVLKRDVDANYEGTELLELSEEY
ncbi:MAG: hypothetical protein ACR2PK_18775 [Acidimicrobiales bacterium]